MQRTVQGTSTSIYVDSSLVVQVTKSGVGLFEYDMALGEYVKVGDRWTPSKEGTGWTGREIVAADVNSSQFIVALSGCRLVLLNLSEKDEFQLVT